MRRASDLAVAVARAIWPQLRRIGEESGRAAYEHGQAAGRDAWVAAAAAVIRETLGEVCGWRPCGCTEAERPDCEWCGGEGVLVVWGTTGEEVAGG